MVKKSDLSKIFNDDPDGYKSSKKESKEDFMHYLASSGFKENVLREKTVEEKKQEIRDEYAERVEELDDIAHKLLEYAEKHDEGFIFTPFNEKMSKYSLCYTNLDVYGFGAAICASICAYCRTHNEDLEGVLEAITETCKKLWKNSF